MNYNIIPEGDDFKVEYSNLGHLQAQIDILEDNTPDKRTKGYELWKSKINMLFEEYNKISGAKYYKLIN